MRQIKWSVRVMSFKETHVSFQKAKKKKEKHSSYYKPVNLKILTICTTTLGTENFFTVSSKFNHDCRRSFAGKKIRIHIYRGSL